MTIEIIVATKENSIKVHSCSIKICMYMYIFSFQYDININDAFRRRFIDIPLFDPGAPDTIQHYNNNNTCAYSQMCIDT